MEALLRLVSELHVVDASGVTSGRQPAPGKGVALRLAPPPPQSPFRDLGEEVAELEQTRMAQALEACGGVKARAAELIGMPLRTFVTKSKRYGLSQPRSAPGPRRARP